MFDAFDADFAKRGVEFCGDFERRDRERGERLFFFAGRDERERAFSEASERPCAGES